MDGSVVDGQKRRKEKVAPTYRSKRNDHRFSTKYQYIYNDETDDNGIAGDDFFGNADDDVDRDRGKSMDRIQSLQTHFFLIFIFQSLYCDSIHEGALC